MTKVKKCLYCYESLFQNEANEDSSEFHSGCLKSFFNTSMLPMLDLKLESLSVMASKMITRKETIPGVQPKLSLSIIKEVVNQNPRLTILDALEGNFILKPPSDQFKNLPENESLTMQLAAQFGIKTVPNSLIRLKSGELAYITKRIDRNKGRKIHMLDFYQILEAFDKYRSSYDAIGNALIQYSQNGLIDRIYFFELILFSFITGNSDMHLKNFSLILKNGTWQLSPAYNLINVKIVLPDDLDDTALTLGGKKRKLERTDFEGLGIRIGMTEKQIKSAIDRIALFYPTAIKFIMQSFLDDTAQEMYIEILKERYTRLNIDFIPKWI